MSTSVTMTYGSYSFAPVPTFTYARAAERTPGQDFCLSTPITIELNGLIVPTGSDGSLSGGFGPVTDQVKELSSTFTCGSCETFQVECDGSDVFNGPARVTNLNVQPRTDGDPYVNTAAYSISLEMVSMTGDDYDNQPSGITAISEDWNFEILDERVAGSVDTSGVFNDNSGSINVDGAFTISHNVTVTAPFQCKTGDGESDIIGWEQAVEYVTNELAVNTPENGLTGLFLPAYLSYYNHFRTVSKSVYEGTITLTDTWTASTNSGALEDFSVNIDDNLDSYQKTVTINGTIQGLATVSYPGASGTPKLSNAFDYWKQVSGSIYSRATTIYDGNISSDGGNRSLNNIPVSKAIGYNTPGGTVTYNYTFNDRPYNCVANAKAEIININENDPNDVFTSVTVLGRQQGPLFQDINTFGPKTREISIEAILPPDTGCLDGGLLSYAAPNDYDVLVSGYEAYVTGSYEQAFVNSQSKTWSPKDGRFTFSKSWTVGECS